MRAPGATGVRRHGLPRVRVRTAAVDAPRTEHLLSLVSSSARPFGEQELSAVRKVHHPKIVQRSDGRWLVSCQDCERLRDLSAPEGINSPVDSFEAAERLWASHCERRSSPVRRRS
jgi:hypothetical protein